MAMGKIQIRDEAAEHVLMAIVTDLVDAVGAVERLKETVAAFAAAHGIKMPEAA
jgi:hypothetical protein